MISITTECLSKLKVNIVVIPASRNDYTNKTAARYNIAEVVKGLLDKIPCVPLICQLNDYFSFLWPRSDLGCFLSLTFLAQYIQIHNQNKPGKLQYVWL